MKRLQEETMCKMAVLGKGSMKDRQKEDELRNSLDPKYAHLSDDLHVEISALGPPAEAHARIAFALAEVRKYLIPDNNDNIRQEQMREMEIMTSSDIPIEEPRSSRRAPGIIRGK
jgi:KH domain-containing RNA-binding signal transduction-associated protein 3